MHPWLLIKSIYAIALCTNYNQGSNVTEASRNLLTVCCAGTVSERTRRRLFKLKISRWNTWFRLLRSAPLWANIFDRRQYCKDHIRAKSFFDNIGDCERGWVTSTNHFVSWSTIRILFYSKNFPVDLIYTILIKDYHENKNFSYSYQKAKKVSRSQLVVELRCEDMRAWYEMTRRLGDIFCTCINTLKDQAKKERQCSRSLAGLRSMGW